MARKIEKVTFKNLTTGNTVSSKNPEGIRLMRNSANYVEISSKMVDDPTDVDED